MSHQKIKINKQKNLALKQGFKRKLIYNFSFIVINNLMAFANYEAGGCLKEL